MKMQQRLDVHTESKKRVRALKFCDPVSNVCAGEAGRHQYFVKYEHGHYVHITDGKGRFSDTDIDVIYKGHLSEDECKKLFEPVWEANFG